MEIPGKNWRRHAAFLKRIEGALATQDARYRQKEVLSPIRDFCHLPCQGRVRIVRTSRTAVVEKREKRGKSIKSIRSHERSKQRSDEKRKFSKEEKRARGSTRSMRKKKTEEGFVMLAGIHTCEYIHTLRLRALTRGSIPRHMERVRARESRFLEKSAKLSGLHPALSFSSSASSGPLRHAHSRPWRM